MIFSFSGPGFGIQHGATKTFCRTLWSFQHWHGYHYVTLFADGDFWLSQVWRRDKSVYNLESTPKSKVTDTKFIFVCVESFVSYRFLYIYPTYLIYLFRKAQAAKVIFAMAIFLTFPLQNFVAYSIIYRKIHKKVSGTKLLILDYLLRVALVVLPCKLLKIINIFTYIFFAITPQFFYVLFV